MGLLLLILMLMLMVLGAFTANRASSDGTIIDIQKDGSTVGSIGSSGGANEVYIGNNR